MQSGEGYRAMMALFFLFAENMLFTKYADVFTFKKRPSQSKSEMYESSVEKSVKVFQFKREQNWSEEDFEMATRFVVWYFMLVLDKIIFSYTHTQMYVD